MTRILLAAAMAVLCLLGAFSASEAKIPVSARKPHHSANLPQKTPFPSQASIRSFIVREARLYGVSASLALFVAEHESRFHIKEIGDDGISWGIWQINLRVHKDITRKCSLDLLCATKWAMPRLKSEPNIWSSFRYRYQWYPECRKRLKNCG